MTTTTANTIKINTIVPMMPGLRNQLEVSGFGVGCAKTVWPENKSSANIQILFTINILKCFYELS